MQNALQKEITSLRDTNRTQQLRLRDIEVANDDFERQARNTTSSLEDLESKYNQTIERGVMLEEEIKVGEQEREQLRIEAQRLRDELSDLKIEAEITQEKLRAADGHVARHLKRKSQMSDGRDHGLTSPTSETSFASSLISSSSTPPHGHKSEGSHATTPPSPPLSDVVAQRAINGGVSPPKKKIDDAYRDANVTPRPSQYLGSRARHTRGPSLAQPPVFNRSQIARPRPSVGGEPVARSESLYQIRGLIGKMQSLEKRVQSARSKLPAPTNTPPRASPRPRADATPAGPSTLSTSNIPSSVTLRSSRKRSSIATSATPSRTDEESGTSSRLGHRPSRISMGAPQRAVGTGGSRPSSRTSNAGIEFARPSSRVSNVGGADFARPSSRASVVHDYGRPASALDARRPASSMSGSYAASQHSNGHGHRQSQHWVSESNEGDFATPTQRRLTNGTGIPTPGSLMRRQSVQALPTPSRRKSTRDHGMGPPEKVSSSSDLGETY